MGMIKKRIGNAEFIFCVNRRNNRSGFVHECELYMDGRELAVCKRQYYNRTWERYDFQSVMLDCVGSAIDQARERITDREKYQRGWSKLTKTRREEIDAIVEQDAGIKILRELRDMVYNANYGTDEERERLEQLDSMLAIMDVLFGKHKAA